MPSQNDRPHEQHDPALPPPSFTPASGRPRRPQRTPAIEVGSPDTGPQDTRRSFTNEPPTNTDSQKIVKIRRASGDEKPSTAQRDAAVPGSVPPRRSTHTVQPPSMSDSQRLKLRRQTQARGQEASSLPPQSADPTTVRPSNAQAQSHEASTPASFAPQSIAPRRERPMPAPSNTGNERPKRISGGGARAATPSNAVPSSRSVGGSGQDSARTPSGRPAAQRGSSATASGSRAFAPNSDGPSDPAGPSRPSRSKKKRVALIVSLLLLAILVAWPIGLLMWANSKLNHIDALSSAPDTSGTTYLIAGSDSRGEDDDNEIKGARADTIMVLHVPDSGPTALISLPRDIYVPIPGHNSNKINASFSYGGAPLLVETVEQFTGYKVDHYVEVGFGGVKDVVNAVGGVELCLDYNVNDKQSELKWKKGCHVAKGKKALAFARMRKADPLGDIGRAERQRQVVSAISKKLQSPGKLINPKTQVSLVNAGTGALVVSEGTGFVDLAKLALAFRSANSENGITGTPPLLSLDYRPGGVGSAVQVDEEASAKFFSDIAAGKLKPGEYNKLR